MKCPDSNSIERLYLRPEHKEDRHNLGSHAEPNFIEKSLWNLINLEF